MRFFRPIHAVRAVTFDLDDTLYNNEPIIQSATQALQQHLQENFPHAAALPLKKWQTIKRDLIKETPELSSDMGQLRLRSLQVALRQDVAKADIEREAENCFTLFYQARSDFSLAEDVHQTLATLAEQVPLIGITNGNVDADSVGFSQYFTHILHANLSRPMKPHRAMFDEAAQLCDLPPSQILHVGDNLEKDVMGAHRAGFQTAWFACNRPMNLKHEPASVLPSVMLDSLTELTHFI